jgi:hypothetical protein
MAAAADVEDALGVPHIRLGALHLLADQGGSGAPHLPAQTPLPAQLICLLKRPHPQ